MVEVKAFSTPYGRRSNVRHLGVPVGWNQKSGCEERLPLSVLATHMHVVGPTGGGKSRLLLWLFQCLSRLPEVSVVLVNPKGNLFQMARDWAVVQGLTSRLVLFDPGDAEMTVGYNPLRANGLSVVNQAKAVREGVRAAWGQTSFDATPQLARFLLLALCAVRECELTLLEAMRLLRAGPNAVRQAILGRLGDSYVREALQYFHGLREQRQEELVASTMARLEAFVFDPTIRQILTQEESLDLGSVLEERKLLLVNLEQYRPLRPDDVRLLGRLIVNDLFGHVFARPKQKRHPVFLILDEVHTFATEDLCVALSQGRELGLHCVLSHTHLEQLRLEDESERLLSAVKNDARTKVVFGGGMVDDLKLLTEDLFIDQFDPWAVKDEITSLELEPIETTREVKSESATVGGGLMFGSGHSSGTGVSNTNGTVMTAGHSTSQGSARSSGSSSGISTSGGESELLLPTGEVVAAAQHGSAATEGSFASQTDIHSEAEHQSRSRQRAVARSRSEGQSSSSGIGLNASKNWGVSTVPFYEYERRRVVSSRTFLSKEEQLTLYLQRLKEQPTGHFVLKVPGRPAVFVRAPLVRETMISTGRRRRALERVYAQPFYRPINQVEAVEADRLPKPSAVKWNPYDEASDSAEIEERRSTRRRAARKSTTPFKW